MFSLGFTDKIKDSAVRNQFELNQSEISQWETKEHTIEGAHADITATSITLQAGLVGVVTPLTFSASRFSSSAGTWAVTAAVALQYTRVGQLAFVQFLLDTSTLSGSSSTLLYIQMPELHGLPTRSANFPLGSLIPGGSVQWIDSQHTTRGWGPVIAQATVLTGAAPSTRLVLYPDATGTTPFPVSNDLIVQGSCWFSLTKNNVALPFFGM